MLTPIDIENKEFAKAFRGYDSIEVDEFMQTLVADYESLYRENASLKEKHAILSETLENYKGMESTMQNAILVAQKTSEDIKQHAYERSNTIQKEAEVKAGNIIAAAEKRAQELEKEYSALKKEMNTFKARMSSLLHTYLRLIEDAQQKEQPDTAELNQEAEAAAKKEAPKNTVNETPAKEVKSDESYTPKKINPLVDELLKQRQAQNNAEASSDAPTEMIIDFKDGANNEYDVFSDKTL